MERGGTAGEIDNALRMARQIADKHNIDLESINTSEESALTTLSHKKIRIAKSSDDDDCAAMLIQTFFHVDVVFTSGFDIHAFDHVKDLVIIGTEIDIAIAEYVFGFLQAHFKACWRRRNKRIKKRKVFVYAMAEGIAHKLRDGHEVTVRAGSVKEALMISRRAYTEKLFPKLTSSKMNRPNLSGGAAAAGFGAGRQTNIRQPISGSSPAAPLMLK